MSTHLQTATDKTELSSSTIVAESVVALIVHVCSKIYFATHEVIDYTEYPSVYDEEIFSEDIQTTNENLPWSWYLLSVDLQREFFKANSWTSPRDHHRTLESLQRDFKEAREIIQHLARLGQDLKVLR